MNNLNVNRITDGNLRLAGKLEMQLAILDVSDILRSCIFASASLKNITTGRVIALLFCKEESPDSIEQCTGEEPGMDISSDELSVTDSATENNYHQSIGGKGENVRQKLTAFNGNI